MRTWIYTTEQRPVQKRVSRIKFSWSHTSEIPNKTTGQWPLELENEGYQNLLQERGGGKQSAHALLRNNWR